MLDETEIRVTEPAEQYNRSWHHLYGTGAVAAMRRTLLQPCIQFCVRIPITPIDIAIATLQLLIIDDDSAVAEFLAATGHEFGFETAIAQRLPECESYFKANTPQLIILDLLMPEIDGVELLRWLAKQQSKAGILLASGMDVRVLNTALTLGKELRLNMLGSLQKPMHIKQLEPILNQVAQQYALLIDNTSHYQKKTAQRFTPITVEDLRTAIERRELINHYQPQITFDYKISGVEALVRWQRPGTGLVPPMEFIPLAERSGLIGPLTWAMLESGLENLAAWNARGLNLLLSVNLAPVLLDDLELPDKIADCIRKHSVNSSSLVLEITESGAMQNAAKSMDILSRLRLKGFALSMDDFGTGYSSLVQLHRLPFSELKIDRAFVQEIERSNEAQTIVRISIDLARNLGLTTCAEGVETEQALKLLNEYQCTHAQGYYISKPQPAAELLPWMEKWGREHG